MVCNWITPLSISNKTYTDIFLGILFKFRCFKYDTYLKIFNNIQIKINKKAKDRCLLNLLHIQNKCFKNVMHMNVDYRFRSLKKFLLQWGRGSQNSSSQSSEICYTWSKISEKSKKTTPFHTKRYISLFNLCDTYSVKSKKENNIGKT